MVRIGQLQWEHPPDHLAGNPQGLTTRHHDPQSRAGSQERLREPGTVIGHVFAVIQKQ